MFRQISKNGVEIPSSSLADIAFLLLIFFLVCTTIDVDKGLQLVLPAYKSEPTPIPRKNISNILINDNGSVMMDGRLQAIHGITSLAREKIGENDQLIFSLKTTHQAPYEIYIDVLDALKQAGAIRISIADPD